MPTTHRNYFDEDIARAKAILQTSEDLKQNGMATRQYRDVRLSAIALAVGAMDAYFCDAYVDCLTSVLRAYAQDNWHGDLPAAYAKRQLPAGEVLDTSRPHRPLWAVRMAVRGVMERDNMLTISKIDEYFNGILPGSRKLWLSFIPKLISYNFKRLTQYREADILDLDGKSLTKAKKKAIHVFKTRIGQTIQIRHDWIHNCGRPKQAIKDLTYGQAQARTRDIEIFVTEFDDHIQAHRLV